jgi:hypothetical protein
LHVAQTVEHRVFGVDVEMNERHEWERFDYIVPTPLRQRRGGPAAPGIKAGRPELDGAGRPARSIAGRGQTACISVAGVEPGDS